MLMSIRYFGKLSNLNIIYSEIKNILFITRINLGIPFLDLIYRLLDCLECKTWSRALKSPISVLEMKNAFTLRFVFSYICRKCIKKVAQKVIAQISHWFGTIFKYCCCKALTYNPQIFEGRVIFVKKKTVFLQNIWKMKIF